jgi:hypothetical protein
MSAIREPRGRAGTRGGSERAADEMIDEERQRLDDADMTWWPETPVIYEVNTAIWLGDLFVALPPWGCHLLAMR